PDSAGASRSGSSLSLRQQQAVTGLPLVTAKESVVSGHSPHPGVPANVQRSASAAANKAGMGRRLSGSPGQQTGHGQSNNSPSGDGVHNGAKKTSRLGKRFGVTLSARIGLSGRGLCRPQNSKLTRSMRVKSAAGSASDRGDREGRDGRSSLANREPTGPGQTGHAASPSAHSNSSTATSNNSNATTGTASAQHNGQSAQRTPLSMSN
ncbi:MAP/microtubule affinity-regulating kinase 3-like, partial [Tropilaelaps mercedesae]